MTSQKKAKILWPNTKNSSGRKKRFAGRWPSGHLPAKREGCWCGEASVKRSAEKEYLVLYFYLSGNVLFIVFYFYPALHSIKMSLFDYKITGGNYVGLANYINIFRNEQFVKSIINTFWFVAYVVPASIIFSLIVAAMIVNKGEVFKSFIRGSFYIPSVVSFVALSMVWSWIYNPVFGLAQYITKAFGFGNIEFFGSRATAIAALALIVFTTAIGQNIVLYTAAMGGIPQTYYEAANIDGATRLTQFFNITLPLVKPTTLFLTVIVTINTFQIFVVVQLLTSGGPDNGMSTILFQLFRTAFEYNNFGLASTMGIILFVIILIISLVQYKFLSSDIEY